MPHGVYIGESEWPERPVNDLMSSVVAFVGYTEKATYSEDIGFGTPGGFRNVGIYDNDLVFTPVRVRSLGDFIRVFGGGDGARENFYLYFSIKLFFENGGGECLVVSVRNNKDGIFADDLIKGLNALKNESSYSLLVIPEAVCLSDFEDSIRIQHAMLRHCAESSFVRFAILDIFGGFSSEGSPVDNFRNGICDNSGNEADYLEYGAAYYPWVKVYYNYMHKEVEIPASAGVAAQYMQQQWRVGIWKSPANLPMKGMTSVCVDLTESDIPSVTTPPDGVPGVNVIKRVPYSEPLIWGARTLSKRNSINRYINVKRTVDMIEYTIDESLNEFRYNSNTIETRLRIENRINQYLESLRIRGALAGHTCQESYKVKISEHDNSGSQKGAIEVYVSVAIAVPGVFVELGR